MQTPEVGSKRRHYKSSGNDDFTYQVVGIGKHTESDEIMVIYKPLYSDSSNRLQNAHFAVRPLSMRYEKIQLENKEILRFTLIS